MPKPKKEERLQLRMDPDLKNWFKQDAEAEGGMSRVVHQQVESRYAEKTGKPWSGSTDAATSTGSNDGREGDPA